MGKGASSLQLGEQSMSWISVVYPCSVHDLHTCAQQPWHCPQALPTSPKAFFSLFSPDVLPQPPAQIARVILG